MKKTKQYGSEDKETESGARKKRVCAKEDKNVWIFRIRDEINAVYDTGEKEDTIIKQV